MARYHALQIEAVAARMRRRLAAVAAELMAASGLLPVGWETLTAIGGGRMLAGRWCFLVCSLEHALSLGQWFGRGARATRDARTVC